MFVLTLLAGCANPFLIDVTNETGAELWLEWDTSFDADGVAIKDGANIPAEGGRLEYTEAPTLNKKWDVTVTAIGAYGVGTRTLENQSRDEVGEMTWDASSVKNLLFTVHNDSGSSITSFHMQERGGADIDPNNPPGMNYGPIYQGESIDISLPADDGGYDWMAVNSSWISIGFILGEDAVAGTDVETSITDE